MNLRIIYISHQSQHITLYKIIELLLTGHLIQLNVYLRTITRRTLQRISIQFHCFSTDLVIVLRQRFIIHTFGIYEISTMEIIQPSVAPIFHVIF